MILEKLRIQLARNVWEAAEMIRAIKDMTVEIHSTVSPRGAGGG